MMTRELLEQQEGHYLAPYAVLNSHSRGRKHPEDEHPYRTRFQRDRDRVIHSAAFRRLKHKTQVFAAPNDDHFRTRLTHTMEVAQISRTIAKTLRLNEDLAEAVALAHDLGHTPFGHAGEEALREIFKDDGGFNHNAQSLRVIDLLEDRYPHFRGLNLTYEVREGIVKHETDYDMPVDASFQPHLRASLEGQLVNLADEIAYNAHDVDDGCFSERICMEELREVPIIDRLWRESVEIYPELTTRKRHYHLVRLLINWAVTDLISNTARRIEAFGIRSCEDVLQQTENIVSFSPEAEEDGRLLKKFLFEKLYRHPELVEINTKARQIVRELFDAYLNNPESLKAKYQGLLSTEPAKVVVKDYIAGMTDRFALQEHARLVGGSSSNLN
jgi:dGTPase